MHPFIQKLALKTLILGSLGICEGVFTDCVTRLSKLNAST